MFVESAGDLLSLESGVNALDAAAGESNEMDRFEFNVCVADVAAVDVVVVVVVALDGLCTVDARDRTGLVSGDAREEAAAAVAAGSGETIPVLLLLSGFARCC